MENWFCNKITVQAEISFQMDLHLFQKSKNYNCHIRNQSGVSKVSVLHFQNKFFFYEHDIHNKKPKNIKKNKLQTM